MPIYEYVCEKCDHCFEFLVFSAKDPAPNCLQCDHLKVKNSCPPAVCDPKEFLPAPAGLNSRPVPLQPAEVFKMFPWKGNHQPCRKIAALTTILS